MDLGVIEGLLFLSLALGGLFFIAFILVTSKLLEVLKIRASFREALDAVHEYKRLYSEEANKYLRLDQRLKDVTRDANAMRDADNKRINDQLAEIEALREKVVIAGIRIHKLEKGTKK